VTQFRREFITRKEVEQILGRNNIQLLDRSSVALINGIQLSRRVLDRKVYFCLIGQQSAIHDLRKRIESGEVDLTLANRRQKDQEELTTRAMRSVRMRSINRLREAQA
jgi:hypothetical protein